MSNIHFEQLWEQCEKLHQESLIKNSVPEILAELSLKINLYKIMDSKSEISPEECQKIKIRTMGEILLSLTDLSLKDNIDVFQALSEAMQYRSIEHYSQKHPV
jgi:hypothetical protein